MSGYIAETGIKNINNYVIVVNSCRSSRVSNTGGGERKGRIKYSIIKVGRIEKIKKREGRKDKIR